MLKQADERATARRRRLPALSALTILMCSLRCRQELPSAAPRRAREQLARTYIQRHARGLLACCCYTVNRSYFLCCPIYAGK
eukprot:6200621-Pleurochrysis_carterae.AAC.4